MTVCPSAMFRPRSPLHRFYRYGRRQSLFARRRFSRNSEERIRRNSELNWLELWHGCTALQSTPKVIQVGTNLFCNLRCNFCRLNQPATREMLAQKSVAEKELGAATLRRLLELVPYAERVTLTPLGEPLLWSGLEEFLGCVREIGSGNVELTSNGMLLERFASLLTRRNVRAITLSVDTNDPIVYSGMRVNGDLSQVERGVRLLCASGERPRLTIASTFMRRNIEQLPSMVAWAQGLGVDALAVQLMDIENPEQESEHLRLFPDLTQRMLSEAIDVGERLGFLVVISEGMGRFLKKETDEKGSDAAKFDAHYYCNARVSSLLVEQCTDPWSSLLIDTDGDCRPCCWAGISYGNLSDGNPFSNVWNSAIAQATRRSFLQGVLPSGCRDKHCRVSF